MLRRGYMSSFVYCNIFYLRTFTSLKPVMLAMYCTYCIGTYHIIIHFQRANNKDARFPVSEIESGNCGAFLNMKLCLENIRQCAELGMKCLNAENESANRVRNFYYGLQ